MRQSTWSSVADNRFDPHKWQASDQPLMGSVVPLEPWVKQSMPWGREGEVVARTRKTARAVKKAMPPLGSSPIWISIFPLSLLPLPVPIADSSELKRQGELRTNPSLDD